MTRAILQLALLLAFLCSGIAHAAGGLPDAVTPDGGRYYGSLREGKLSGLGRIEWDDGRRYEGAFREGLFHGRGKLVMRFGATYDGDFAKGLFDGRGRYESETGEIYEGDFKAGQFTGKGIYSRPDGARYRGEFLNWQMHGQGRFIDAGGEVAEGEWKNGRLPGDRSIDKAGLAVETALLTQRRLLERALADLAPGRPGVIDMYLVAVAGDGSQEVFRREVDFVRAQFDQRFGTKSRSVVLVNSRNTVSTAPMATVSALEETLKAVAAKMNRDEDILFLFLTSHGTREHELKLTQNYMTLRDLPAAELGRMLKESDIRWKVVVVSACYSGGFIDALKDERTLLITAARHDRSSFGCSDEADFTYFGRAFFKEALPKSGSFQEAFAKADALVAEWEKKDQPKEPRSQPQMVSPSAITEVLKRWWPQRGQ